MFLGTYQTTFTGLGRVVLPKKIRQALSTSEVVLTSGIETSIWGFNKQDWEKQAEIILKIPLEDETGRLRRRQFFGHAEVVLLDNQGRIVISNQLLRYAGISNQIVIIGAGDHFEIWNPDNLV